MRMLVLADVVMWRLVRFVALVTVQEGGPWYPTSCEKRARYGAPLDSFRVQSFESRIACRTQAKDGLNGAPEFCSQDRDLRFLLFEG